MSGDHKNRAHALLSASGSSRWLNCTPSARLEDDVCSPPPSKYAEEGTLAHEIAELKLNFMLGFTHEESYRDLMEAHQRHELYQHEMLEYVDVYVDYVYKLASKNFSVALIEQRINLSRFVPESFGSNDAIVINGNSMEVIDLKYGKGLRVSAKENSQLMLYALGALDEFGLMYDIQDIKLTIVQPRLDSISSYEISAVDLYKWANDYVKPRAAMAFEGLGEKQAGDHCRWCKIQLECDAVKKQVDAIASQEFMDHPIGASNMDHIMEMYNRIPIVETYITRLKEFLFDKALDGHEIPGYKLVAGRSNRTFKDKEATLAYFKRSKYRQDQYLDKKLKGLGELEKLIGKDKLATMVFKPEGKPTLVPESDDRPELSIGKPEIDFDDLF